MVLDQRCYRTLVVSSSSKFNEGLKNIFADAHCRPITYTDSVAAARRCALENSYDFVIVNSPLKDENGLKFAIDISSGKSTVCLFFIKAESYSEIKSHLSPYGVFVVPKPISATSADQAMSFLTSARERLRSLEKTTQTIEQKMEEIRLVNRAKWLLIDRENMTESEAHRYIEKQAMDSCISKKEVAGKILNKYA